MDSVEGHKGGKVLLTLHFVKPEFMLAFLCNRNTAASVSEIIERLYWELQPDRFMEIFTALLRDNRNEFSVPLSIAIDSENNQRTMVFYCDPSAPYQKGAAEKIMNSSGGFCQRELPLMI